MDGGGREFGMEAPVVLLSTEMTRWAVCGRQSHPFVSFSDSRWAATTGRSAYAVCNRVTTSVRTPVRPRWSCGAGLGGLGRLTSVHSWNQTRVLVRAKGDWGTDDSRRFYGNGLEEGQDVVAIICDGGQRLGGGRLSGGLLRLNWFCLCFFGVNGDDTIVVIGLVCLSCEILVLRPLHDGSGENLEELARVRLAVEDRGLRQKRRKEDGVAWSPVPLLLRLCEVAGGGAKEDFRDR